MNCQHEHYAKTKRQTFCLDCGEPIVGQPTRRYLRPHDVPTGWRTVDDMPPMDAPYFVAWAVGPHKEWYVLRVPETGALPPLATHWHADTMGLPST
jgi:hypothetical protein